MNKNLLLLISILFSGIHNLFSQDFKSPGLSPENSIQIIENKITPIHKDINIAKAKTNDSTIVIGDLSGYSTGMLPISDGCSYSQQLFFQDEINVENKRISSLSFYYMGDSLWSDKIEVYMAHTDSTRLRAFLPAEMLTRVYSGPIVIDSTPGWATINLTLPFNYNNTSNLVIAVIDNQDNQIPMSYVHHSYFAETLTNGTDWTGPVLAVMVSATGPITVANPPWTGSMRPFRNDIKLGFEDIPQKPMLYLEPEVLDVPYYSDYGSVMTGSVNNKYLRVKNIGNLPVTITGAVFSDYQENFSLTDANMTIDVGENISIPIEFSPTNIGEYESTMHLQTDVECEGDLDYVLRATAFQRGYLHEGFEFDPLTYPPLFWDNTTGNTNFPEAVPYNWYVNHTNYPGTYCYERYGLVQNWGGYGVYDTIITPKLNISSGDSLVFYAYGGFYGGDLLPLVYSSDKINWQVLDTVIMQEFELLQEDPKGKWTRFVVDLTPAAGENYIGFCSGYGVVHLDQIDGPAMALKNNDLLITSFSGPVSLSVDAQNLYQVDVLNAGFNPQASYDIKLMQAGETPVELARISGHTVNFFDTVKYIIPYTPSTEGNFNVYAEIEFAEDEEVANNLSDTLQLSIYNNTSIIENLGMENNENLYWFPLNFNFETTLGEVLYYADELQVGESQLQEIQLFMHMTHNISNKGIKVWVGETNREDLHEGFIPANQLILVYENDSMNFNTGDFTFRIPFIQPYQYTGQNLVVLIQRTMDDTYYTWEHRFYVSQNENHTRRGLLYYDRMFEIDPNNPPGMENLGVENVFMELVNVFPDAAFVFDVDGLGEIRGTVGDAYNDPIEGAEVFTPDSYYSTITEADGSYRFPYMNAGPVDVTASKENLYSQTQTASVISNFYQVLDFTLTARNRVNLSGIIVDHNNTPLENAIVTVTGYDNADTISNLDGSFSIDIWSDAEYQLKIEKYGYEDYITTVNILSSDTSLGNITLTEIPSFPGMVHAEIVDSNTMVNWSEPEPSLAHEFRYDTGINFEQIGYNGTQRSIIGSVYRNKALINEVSYYFTEYKTTNQVEVYIFGLDELGRPDKNLLLHKSRPQNCETNQWNTYSLDVAVYAEHGFFVALSAAGYLSLGTSTTSAEYPFMQETYFGNFNIDDTTAMGTIYSLDYDGLSKNLMLRANGYNFGAIDFEYSKIFRNNLPLAHNHKIESYSGKLVFTKEPTYLYNNQNIKSFESYSVYRFSENDLVNTSNWTLISENVQDTFFVDNNFSTLEKGIYYYAIEAVYDSGLPSYKRISNPVRKDLASNILVHINLPENVQLGSMNVKLENTDKYLGIEFNMEDINSSDITFHDVWQGNYKLEISHPNSKHFINEYEFTNTEENITVNLEDATQSPDSLKVVNNGQGGAEFSWQEPVVNELIYDDGSFESAFFYTPGYYGEFGNLYQVNGDMILTGVNVFGVEHPWGIYGQTVKVKVYNIFEEFIGESDTIQLPATNWITVPLPNIEVSGFFYVMVSWDYLLRPTNTLGLDTTGTLAITKKPAVVKDNYMNFVEFGAAGGISGAFLIRPFGYLSENKSENNHPRNNDINICQSSYSQFPKKGLAGDVPRRESNISYKVFLNDLQNPIEQDYAGLSYDFNGLSEGSHVAGVSSVYPLAESQVATVNFNFPFASIDATLSAIWIDGELLDDFNPQVFTYIVNIPEGYVGLPGVEYTTTDGNATADMTYDDAESFVYIYVTAEDGITQNTYSIFFNRTISVEALNTIQAVFYPNPASQGIFIENAVAMQVKLFNVLGTQLKSFYIDNDKYYLNVEGIEPGCYLLQFISSSGQTTTKRVVIKH